MRYMIFLWILLTSTVAATGENWPQFRGPTGDGHATTKGLPLSWSETENVTWKVPIPGRAWSSPVVWDDQIWMTNATEEGHDQSVVAVDRKSGKTLFDRNVFYNKTLQITASLNSHASPTPVIESGRVWVHFGTYGTACLDTATGKILWKRRDLNCDHFRGPGSSPLILDDLLILHFDGIDVQYLVALNKETGKTVWRSDRSTDFRGIDPDFRKAYSTPTLIVHDGRRQLISPGAQAAFAYNPTTGKELWKVRYRGFSNVSRPLYGEGLVFLNTGFARPQLWAVRPEGSGDVTETHVAWKLTRNVPAKPTPVLIDGLLYMCDDRGVASCLEAKTGSIVWQKRFGGDHSASPVFADGRIYFFDHSGTTKVIAPGRTFRLLAENQLDAGCMASPAVVDSVIFLRTKTHLYRLELPSRGSRQGSSDEGSNEEGS